MAPRSPKARELGAEVINFDEVDVPDAVLKLTDEHGAYRTVRDHFAGHGITKYGAGVSRSGFPQGGLVALYLHLMTSTGRLG